MFDVTREKH